MKIEKNWEVIEVSKINPQECLRRCVYFRYDKDKFIEWCRRFFREIGPYQERCQQCLDHFGTK